MSQHLDIPPDLPVPHDDGACAHLTGRDFPDVVLPATGPFTSDTSEATENAGGRAKTVSMRELSQSGLVVVFFYPRTAPPDEIVPKEWNDIPGARGCTPQNCKRIHSAYRYRPPSWLLNTALSVASIPYWKPGSFRDNTAPLTDLGVPPSHLFGCSTQSTEVHAELSARLHLPYALLSDADLKLMTALELPAFDWKGMKLVKRLTLAVENGKIVKVWYPVFPSNANVDAVLDWLKERSGGA